MADLLDAANTLRRFPSIRLSSKDGTIPASVRPALGGAYKTSDLGCALYGMPVRVASWLPAGCLMFEHERGTTLVHLDPETKKPIVIEVRRPGPDCWTRYAP